MDLDTEAKSTDFGCFAKSLDQAGLSGGVLKLNCFDAADVVEVTSVLIVGNMLGESCLADEVARLLNKVLLQKASNKNVHNGSLSNLI